MSADGHFRDSNNKPSQPPTSSPEIILIPLQLRMAWTDSIMLDRGLPALAKVAAGVIGHHFNRRTGDTFLSQVTIARLMGISRRAAQNAIAALEARGFILIRRRELKVVNGVPGKRYYGGKGVANVYLPAIASEPIATTASGRRLVEWAQEQRQRAHGGAPFETSKSEPAFAHSKNNERIDVRALNVQSAHQDPPMSAPGCAPTLSYPSDSNPTRERAGVPDPAPAHPLGDAFDLIKGRIGEVLANSWFGDIKVLAVRTGKDSELVLGARSHFVADYISQNLSDDVRQCFNATMPPNGWVSRVVVEVVVES